VVAPRRPIFSLSSRTARRRPALGPVPARRCPLMVAPAMNVEMCRTRRRSATSSACARRRRHPRPTEGDTPTRGGMGGCSSPRRSSPKSRLRSVQSSFQKKSPDHAGPTMSRSTPCAGSQIKLRENGLRVAQARRGRRGGDACVRATVLAAPQRGARRRDYARDMHKAVMARVKQADVFISVAAVADYHPVDPKSHKIKRGNGQPQARTCAEPASSVRSRASEGPSRRLAAEPRLKQRQENARRRESVLVEPRTRLGQDPRVTLFDEEGVHELARAQDLCASQ